MNGTYRCYLMARIDTKRAIILDVGMYSAHEGNITNMGDETYARLHTSNGCDSYQDAVNETVSILKSVPWFRWCEDLYDDNVKRCLAGEPP